MSISGFGVKMCTKSVVFNLDECVQERDLFR